MAAQQAEGRNDGAAAIQCCSAAVAIISSVVLLRILVGCHHHSGENNYHGKIDGFGGDYEAQRHWMEITYHLPIGRWYKYDLDYWGLDYPPLTAYVSYICGWLSHVLVGPETVALLTSKAYEEASHKSFMRATVLVLDVLVYFTAVWVLAKRMEPRNVVHRLWVVGLALVQPSIILIDHGHFQYNTVALGLALWSFHFMTLPAAFANCIVGSILFCLALNFKQMALYYAPAVFAYLLGKCFAEQPNNNSKASLFFGRFLALGITVIATFAALWLPFVVFRSEGDTASESILQIVQRLFPFQRGLYEGKVSNLWCALSTKPLSFRRRVPERFQPICALVTTLSLCLPSGICAFNVGRKYLTADTQPQHLRSLLWAAAGTSLSFFLASFQVHEKSILLPLAPVSLLVADAPLLCFWFSVTSAWTLWPLIETDRIQPAYFACVMIFSLVSSLYDRPFAALREHSRGNFAIGISVARDIGRSKWIYVTVLVSFAGMIGLHLAESIISPPVSLPDLFPVLWSIGGAGIFCLCWCCFFRQLSLIRESMGGEQKLKSF